MLTFWAFEVVAQIPPDPNLILDRGDFEASGDVVHFADFEEFGPGFTFLPNPWNHEGVTYTTGDNLIVGSGTFYLPISNIFCYNFWTPLPASVSTNPDTFDLIGFDVAFIGRSDPVDITVATNLDIYEYLDLSLQNWNAGSDFFGFKAPGSGEFVTDFIVNTNAGGSAGCIDNVTLAISDIQVAIDIKFCSDPNAFNCKKKGVLPVTIFGTGDFDVTDIDTTTLQLCTEDLVNCTNMPRDYSIADRGNPESDLGAAMCATDDLGDELDYLHPDGFLDLDAAFEASEVQDMLGTFCGSERNAVSESLVITGLTIDGRTIHSVPLDSTGIDQLVKKN